MDTVYEDNLRLSQLEYRQQHTYLRSQPRCLSLVFGNACNIYCPHCYQSKNGDNLLRPAEIGRELRREFMGLYPYLSTLRILGGEPFALVGFRELIEDAASIVHRPIISVSTNGTLIDDAWAERIVRLPFSNLTVSIDGGTPATYARMRQGADLDKVLANVERIQQWKQKLGSELPHLDSFFVVMRSNFREIPQYLELMSRHGFTDVSLQTIEVNMHNAGREPALERDEVIADGAEIRELHAMMQDLLPRERRRFRMIRTSGMTSLFGSQGLDTSFLREESEGLYPDSDDLAEAAQPAGDAAPAEAVEPAAPPEEAAPAVLPPSGDDSAEPAGEAIDGALCPNPWTTLFVAENGDVHVCFLSEPIGNLYETSISRMWNCQRAMAQRSDMIAGRYIESGCSPRWCSWREGKKPAPPRSDNLAELRAETALLAGRAARTESLVPAAEGPSSIAEVRRMVAARDQRIKELEVMFAQLCDNNAAIHDRAQEHIAHLEAKVAAALAELEKNTEIHEKTQQHIAHLEAKAAAAVAALEQNTAAREETQKHIAHLEAKAAAAIAEFQEFAHYRELPLIKIADALSRFLSRLRHGLVRSDHTPT
ncbi:MAG TPA: radical SAM/SPASM domain-containing protein [Bryobacteraceae bacterium]|nr:radical SAM/SPASM domain-containing protein [Bryobacteraceae bacterium]